MSTLISAMKTSSIVSKKKHIKEGGDFFGGGADFASNCSFDWSKTDAANAKRGRKSSSVGKYGVEKYNGSRAITCSQITSMTEAYAWLRAGHGYLDADNDGVPCESLM